MINKISFFHLQLPFKVKFSHSSSERKTGDSVLVVVEGDNLKGYGEGCPREYVTGENWDTAKTFIASIEDQVANIESVESLKTYIDDNRAVVNQNPAAWCAVELAILDYLAKKDKKSIEEYLDQPEIQGDFNYTAIIGTEKMFKLVIQAFVYRLYGFKTFKLKIFGQVEEDIKRLKMLKRIAGNNIQIRIDANNQWKSYNEMLPAIKKFRPYIKGVEEPLVKNMYSELSRLSSELNLPVILDESFLNEGQFSDLDKHTAKWVIKIRISQMGGLLRSLDIAKKAKMRGIPIIIGAHVGESSILTRAALTVANSFKKEVIAQEGAFGTFLLEKDIVSKPLQFKRKGKLNLANNFYKNKYGLGLDIVNYRNIN